MRADLPAMPAYVPGWQHPKGKPPDAVVSLPAFAVKATGEIPYIQLHVKVPLTEDHWIAGMQMLPGNGALVHHMGREAASLEAARRNVDAWTRQIEAGGLKRPKPGKRGADAKPRKSRALSRDAARG